MPNRYYCSNLAQIPKDKRITIRDTEAHHLAKVMRQEIGDAIELFDGSGRWAAAVISLIKKSYVELEVTELHEIDPQLEHSHMSVAAALPKGDRFRWMIEKLTELGIDRFVPLITERSVVIPRDGKIEKMQQTVLTAMKQSKRLIEMTISDPVSWSDLLAQSRSEQAILIADPAGLCPSSIAIDADHKLLICIGPEGGFTDAELQMARQAGAREISLGPAILRTETAAIAAAAYFRLSDS